MSKVKLEKSKVSQRLFEAKKKAFNRTSAEYKILTQFENRIDNCKKDETEKIISLYEKVLELYVMSGLEQNEYKLCGKGLGDVMLLINSKVKHNYLNSKIEEWEKYDCL